MSERTLNNLAAALALSAAAIATAAQAGSPRRFDLVCNGSGVDSDQNKAFQFQTRINVDTVSKRFCIDGFCAAFTKAEPTFFEYECRAHKTFCHVGPTTAGPFVSLDHFTFDWVSRKFERTEEGYRGDRIHEDFRITYSGVCTFGAFSGLKK